MLKLFRFLKPYRLPVAAVLLLLFCQTLAELFLPTLMADIVDQGIVYGDIGYILRVGGVMLLVAGIGVVCLIVASYLSAQTAAGVGRDLRRQVFSRVESFSLHEFDTIGTASLITRTTNDITQVQQVLIMSLRMMVIAPIMAIGGIIMAVSQDAQLSLVIVVVIPILAGAVYSIARKGIPLFKAMQLKLDQLNLVLREGLTGIRVIRAFNRTDFEQNRFNAANLDLTGTAIKVNRMMAVLMPLIMLVMNFTTIAIIWFGSIRINQGEMQVGSLMAFIQYVMQIMFSLIMVSLMFVMIPRAAVSAARINEVLDIQPEIRDADKPRKADSLRGRVEFKNVTFRYPGAEQPALRHISFSAGPGEVTAIIGGTGSGKSTLLNLILRFYDVDSGSVLVDGLDVREMAQADLRSKIGFVPQKASLFSGAVADNIRFGNKNITDPEIKQAAETAQAAEFIAGMPEGLASLIAQGGANLSGGQKQRLAIARALAKKAEIYLFDDSFSALDFQTDARLRAALRPETTDSAVLIVAQRVATVMDADQIIVLDEGTIAGIGRHQELLADCAVYREIVSSQLGEEAIA